MKDFSQSLSQITSETQKNHILLALKENNKSQLTTELNNLLLMVSQHTLFAWTTADARKNQCIHMVLTLRPYWLEKINNAFDACILHNPFKVYDPDSRAIKCTS